MRLHSLYMLAFVATTSGCGEKSEEKNKDNASGDKGSSRLLEVYTGDTAKACHAEGKVVDADGFEAKCTSKKLSAVECTPENLKTLVIAEDAESIESSASNGSQLLQCEDIGAGVRADWYKDSSVGGASRYRFHAPALLFGTYVGAGCASRSTVSVTFEDGKFSRVYKQYTNDDCSGDPVQTFKTEGTVTGKMSEQKIGSEHTYVFEFKIEKYMINVADTTDAYSKNLAEEFSAGCVDSLSAKTDLILTAAEHSECLKTEYIHSIYTKHQITRSFGFAFPSRLRAWESTKEEPVTAGLSTADFDVYREYLLK
jgi:hypothetical protein